MRDITKDEERAVAQLQKLAATWPKGLTLVADGHDLKVILNNPRTGRAYYLPCDGYNERIDQASLVAAIDIRALGGDPW